MKAKLMYLFILLGVMACRDEDRIRIPKVQEGVNMRIVVDPAKSNFASSNLSSSTVEFDAYSINQNLSKVDFIGTYTDYKFNEKNEIIDTVVIADKLVLTLSGSDFTNGKARGVLTAAQVATAFGLAGGINGMGKDDQLTLSPVVTLTDGRVFSAENSAPSITAGANASFTVEFGAAVE